jgi:CHAT domain-containing protein
MSRITARLVGTAIALALSMPAGAQDPLAQVRAHQEREQTLVAAAQEAEAKALDLRLAGKTAESIPLYRRAAEAIGEMVAGCRKRVGDIAYGCAYDIPTYGHYVFDLAYALHDAGRDAEGLQAFTKAEAALAPRLGGCDTDGWSNSCANEARLMRQFTGEKARYLGNIGWWDDALAIRRDEMAAVASLLRACSGDEDCDDRADDLLGSFLALRAAFASAERGAEATALESEWMPRLTALPTYARGEAAGGAGSAGRFRAGVDAITAERLADATAASEAAAKSASDAERAAAKQELDAKLADLRKKLEPVPYSDTATRAANHRERADLIAGFYGEESVEHAEALQLVGVDYYEAKRWSEAADLYAEALSIRRRVEGNADSDTQRNAQNLATFLDRAGRSDEAIALLREYLSDPATDWSARLADPDGRARYGHYASALYAGWTHATFARLLLAHGGDPAEALRSARIAALTSRADRASYGFDPSSDALSRSMDRGENRETGEERLGEYDMLFADAAWAARPGDPALAADVLEALQDATAGSPSRALADKATVSIARIAGAGDLIERRDAKFAEVNAAISEAGDSGHEPAARQDELWTHALALGHEAEAINAQLAAAVPGYFELLRPRPLSLAEARGLFAPDEALLMLAPTARGVHTLAVDAAGVDWRFTPLPAEELGGSIKRLLWDLGASVDVDSETRARWELEGDGAATPFARGAAYDLYRALIEPVAVRLKGKRHTFVVADGALAALPLSVLVTEAPQGQDGDPQALRDTKWFGDTTALVQLPSLQSLKLLRMVEKASGGARGTRFLGYGDPALDGKAITRGIGEGDARRGGAMMPAVASISGAAEDGAPLADVAALRQLARLPGTAAELQAMARLFPGPLSTIHLAGEATEARLKSEDLRGLSVLALSTHGLLADESGHAGVFEPGLVLTPPGVATARDDGLLTAAEVAGLDIDADWVILSACNTAGAEGWSDATGLSGLARAFFFAGARSLLVSHWYVRDDVASQMTVRMLQLRRDNPSLSRAEALRAAMKSIRDDPAADGKVGGWSHPGAWAPFTFVGDVR